MALLLTTDTKDQAVELLGGHKPGGPLRGGKFSAFNAGTQVPFIVCQPGKLKHKKSDVLVSQVDFMASFARLLNQPLQEKDAPDSYEMLDQLLGKSDTGRPHFVHQGVSTLAIIQGDWKYIVPNKGPEISEFTNIEMGNNRMPQFYNLNDDPGETQNLAARYPEKVKELSDLLLKIKEDGRTRF